MRFSNTLVRLFGWTWWHLTHQRKAVRSYKLCRSSILGSDENSARSWVASHLARCLRCTFVCCTFGRGLRRPSPNAGKRWFIWLVGADVGCMLRRFSRKPRGIEPAAPVGARDPEGAMRKLEEMDERASALGPSGLRADHLKNTLSTACGTRSLLTRWSCASCWPIEKLLSLLLLI